MELVAKLHSTVIPALSRNPALDSGFRQNDGWVITSAPAFPYLSNVYQAYQWRRGFANTLLDKRCFALPCGRGRSLTLPRTDDRIPMNKSVGVVCLRASPPHKQFYQQVRRLPTNNLFSRLLSLPC